MASKKPVREPAGDRPRPRGIQSAGVGLAVLETLIHSNRPLFLREVAAGASIAPSLAHRYLASFGEAGMVSQHPVSGKYDLGPLAIQLGLAALRRIDAIDIAVEVLGNLVETTNTDAHLCVLGTAGPTVIRWKEGPGDVNVRVREGVVLPITASATGRVWCAFAPPRTVAQHLERELAALSAETGTDRQTLQKQLDERVAQIRLSGISHSTSERRLGIDAMCAPVFGRDGQLLLTITLLGISARFDSGHDDIARELREACVAISKRLGCGDVDLMSYPWMGGGVERGG